jgi:hypothetical protein
VTINHFKPEVWSKVLLGALQKSLVFGGPMVCNRDYEGEISGPGDTVHITSLGDPTISKYTPNQSITYQPVTDAGQTLVVDQAYYWATQVDDVDKRQAAGNMMDWMETRAAYRIADQADQYLAGLYTQSAPANAVGTSASPITPATYSSTHPADFFTTVLQPLKVKLDQANVPDEGRYAILPPWAAVLMEQTQAFIQFPGNNGGPGDVMQRGYLGQAAGFNLMKSNNAVNYNPSANGGQGNWVIQAGHPMATTYAEQITETEALRLQAVIADGMRGLHVYGAKVVHPEAMAVAYVQRPTGI